MDPYPWGSPSGPPVGTARWNSGSGSVNGDVKTPSSVVGVDVSDGFVGPVGVGVGVGVGAGREGGGEGGGGAGGGAGGLVDGCVSLLIGVPVFNAVVGAGPGVIFTECALSKDCRNETNHSINDVSTVDTSNVESIRFCFSYTNVS